MQSRFIPDDIVEKIRNATDIVDLIGGYIELKRAGSTYKALCPFHNEKTPSFVVTPHKQIFHCFGCGEGGDVFRFVMDYEGVDFPNAAHLLAARSGIIIPEKSSGSNPKLARKRSDHRQRLYKMHEDLASWYHRNLISGENPAVSEYFESRSLSDELTAEFLIGSSCDSWDSALRFLREKGYSEEEMLECGIVKKSRNVDKIHDFFRNRLMFPVSNEQGRIVAFSARSIEKNPEGWKYINSPETPIFKKSRCLYGLHISRKKIRDAGYIILCEGQIDVIAMHGAGYHNSIAPQGTAFTEEQAKILRRYSDKICLALDSDSAGIKAMVKNVDILLPLGFEIKIIPFPENSDPDDIFSKKGAEGIKELIHNAQDFIDMLIAFYSDNFDIHTPAGKSKITRSMLQHIQKLDDSIKQREYLSVLSEKLMIPEFTLEKEFQNIKKTNNKYTKFQSQKSPEADNENQNSKIPRKIIDAEKNILKNLLIHGSVVKNVGEELGTLEILPESPLKYAIKTVLDAYEEGEWDKAYDRIKKNLIEQQNRDLSEILMLADSSESKGKQFYIKELRDSLKTLKIFYIENKIMNLTEKIKSLSSQEDRLSLIQELTKLNKEKISLNSRNNA